MDESDGSKQVTNVPTVISSIDYIKLQSTLVEFCLKSKINHIWGLF